MSILEMVGYGAVLIFSTIGFLVVLCLAWIGANQLAKKLDVAEKVPIETEENADRIPETTQR